MSQRLDAADAAIVGRAVAVRVVDLRGQPQRVLTVEVDQNVKGGLSRSVQVWSPSGTGACALTPKLNTEIGLLLGRTPDGRWVAASGSLVDPGRLTATGGEPRGGAIKVVVGLVLLALVVLWALSRRRRGVRPELPGGPRP